MTMKLKKPIAKQKTLNIHELEYGSSKKTKKTAAKHRKNCRK